MHTDNPSTNNSRNGKEYKTGQKYFPCFNIISIFTYIKIIVTLIIESIYFRNTHRLMITPQQVYLFGVPDLEAKQ